jgi:hypothetical protein
MQSNSILLSLTPSYFEYLYYDRSSGKPMMCRRNHTLDLPPADLTKKITLLKHFRGYMQENLTKAYSEPTLSPSNPPHSEGGGGLEFLTKYLRTKTGVVFRLSNHSIQV